MHKKIKSHCGRFTRVYTVQGVVGAWVKINNMGKNTTDLTIKVGDKVVVSGLLASR